MLSVEGPRRLPSRAAAASPPARLAGSPGGAFAMLPFCWAWLRLDVPGESYLVMTLAVVGFLGCSDRPVSHRGPRASIAHGIGRALARA
ncbi:MAG: hypothetical protein M0C28_16190 [Candidatus Moduliflexus flocculans]|nr:hypothetical protein [Candidatus Moduliflexus flocculans]